MATVPKETHDTVVAVGRRRWRAALDRLESIAPWLIVMASMLTYAGLHVAIVGGAMITAVFLSTAVTGIASVVVFFGVGLPLVVAGRMTAHRLFVVLLAR